MANQNFMNILDPSASADQIQLDRRMKMAEILRQQSMEPDQNQVAGGFVIPTSPFASLNKIASGFLAGKLNSDTDQQRKDMATRQSKMLMDALKGDSPQTTVLPQSPVGQDASGKPLYDNSQPTQTVTQPSQNSQFDLKNLIRGSAIGQVGGDQAAGAYWEGMKPTTEMKNATWMGQDPKLLSQLDIAAKRKAGMMEMQPGTTSLDLATGQERFQPKVGEGINLQGGVASQLPGYAQANAGIQGAQTQAQELNKVLNVTTPSGAQVPMLAGSALGFNPPAGGAPQIGQSTQQKDYQSKIGGAFGDYENNLNNRVQQGADLNMRLQESIQAMDKFKAGGGAETRAQLGQIAQGMGMPDSIVSGVSGGNLASMQEFKKLAVQQAMENLKQAVSAGGGGGKVTQAEFKIFQDNNPNLSTDPNAIRKIFDFNTRVFNRDLTEQKALRYYINTGGQPANFPSYWAGQSAQQGYTNPNLSAQPMPTGTDLHAKADAILRGR